MESVFAQIINKEIPARIVWENEEAICVIPKRHFVNPGHVLLIPKQQVDYLFDLDDELYCRLWKIVKKLVSPLKEVSGAKRIGIAVEGFSVAHAHIHLCPVNHVAELDPYRDIYWSEEEQDKFMEDVQALLKDIDL